MVMNYIPGLHLRATEAQEVAGMDDAELGEFAVSYKQGADTQRRRLTAEQYDYVEVDRDVKEKKEESDSEREKDADGTMIPEKSITTPDMPPGIG